MKKTLILFILLGSLLGWTSSCKKHNDNQPGMRVYLTRNSTYQHNFGLMGIEDGMAITRQASHYQVSKLTRDSTTAELIYTYKPAQDFVGIDHVEITTYISNGAQVVNTSTTSIQFTVTN